MKILVTGANGQVGKEFRRWADEHGGGKELQFLFLSREDLPLHHFPLVRTFLLTEKPDVVINCAAYTAVDKAESEPAMAYLVNDESVGVLAESCKEAGSRLVHISTDYVFDGTSPIPYREDDKTGPLNVYGASKLAGEQRALSAFAEGVIIIRTSWVYSEYGQNFVKTMLRLMRERTELKVVDDQVGAPTYAADLAGMIMQVVLSGRWVPGIFHYSNEGRISWHEFASEIARVIGYRGVIHPIPTSAFPTPARRPAFSLLDGSKLQTQYGIFGKDWRQSLHACLERIDSSK